MRNTTKAPKTGANGHSLALWERLRAKRGLLALILVVSGAVSLLCCLLCLVACGAQDAGYGWSGPLLYFLGAGCPPDEVAALYALFGLFGIVYGNQKMVQHKIDKRSEQRGRRWR